MRDRFGVLVLVALLCSGAAVSGVLYVDAIAPVGGDGSSWNAAFASLGAALSAAQSGDEVRVAQGVYRPGVAGSSRESTFALKTGVTVKGGYAGLGGVSPDARAPSVFVTTLSGDLNGDDAPGFVNRADNAHHVVSAAELTGDATLDGVRIVGGQADGPFTSSVSHDRGGGVFVRSVAGFGESGRLRMVGCVLEDNQGKLGAAMGTMRASVRVTGTTFRGNRAISMGGGFGDQTVETSHSRFEFVGCVFEENRANGLGGAGITCLGVTYTLSLSGCTFTGNEGAGGAAVYTGGASDVHARAMNCVFEGNSGLSGPVWFDDFTSTLRMVNCTMTENSASLTSIAGSTVRFLGLDAEVSNCVMWGNSSPAGSITDLGQTVAMFSNVEGGFSGVGNIDADPLFRDASAGDYRLRRASACVDAGSNALVLSDEFDLNTNGNASEPTPWDWSGRGRFVDDPASAPNGVFPVDMGALERQVCPGDATDDLVVNFADLNVVLSQFGQSGAIGAFAGDVTGDGVVNFADLNEVLSAFGGVCP